MKKILLALLVLLSLSVLFGCEGQATFDSEVTILREQNDILREQNKKFEELIEKLNELDFKSENNITVNTERNIHIDLNDLENYKVSIVPEDKFHIKHSLVYDLENYLFYSKTHDFQELQFIFKEHDLIFGVKYKDPFKYKDIEALIFYKHGFYFIFVKEFNYE